MCDIKLSNSHHKCYNTTYNSEQKPITMVACDVTKKTHLDIHI